MSRTRKPESGTTNSVNTDKNLLNVDVTTDKPQQQIAAQVKAEIDTAIKSLDAIEKAVKNGLLTQAAAESAAQVPNLETKTKTLDAANDQNYAVNETIDDKYQKATGHGVFTQSAQEVVVETVESQKERKEALELSLSEVIKFNHDAKNALMKARDLVKSREIKPDTAPTSRRSGPGRSG